MGVVIALFLLVSIPSTPVSARLDVVTEGPGQTLSKSFQSLRDDAGHPWQAIAFRREFPDGHAWQLLRLVGYPGIVSVARGNGLTISNVRGQSYAAPEATHLLFDDNDIPDNVGQFDVSDTLIEFDGQVPLRLSLELETGPVVIGVPITALQEWRGIYRRSRWDSNSQSLNSQSLRCVDCI